MSLVFDPRRTGSCLMLTADKLTEEGNERRVAAGPETGGKNLDHEVRHCFAARAKFGARVEVGSALTAIPDAWLPLCNGNAFPFQAIPDMQ
ncbi:hypothetical protein N7539_004707 [Penicillium diatomitis]|uniref:Uncharacterized protein n=1 Tax=Penicillium diatomitis TaxID=2819901 RepID=A0A9W9X5G2_9EURO|nr:uncharacterized protein N7539_004707 [Penicillium diatomitis]KAJ5484719.1 hypothetical protein N7539_004707 [Penicillium diatomitis]